MIRFSGVSKAYPGHEPVLQDVNFSVQRGEYVFLTGRSGAGKSTLLKLMLAIEQPSSGEVLIGGQDIARLRPRQLPYFRRKLGVVFQDFKLLPRRTVYENIAFVLEIMGVGRREIRERVQQSLREVGLEHVAHKPPALLSGGEKQRVAIARALVHQPLLLLADEPTGNLDPEIAREIMALFSKANERGTTLVVATHDVMMLESPTYQHCRILRLGEEGLSERRPASAPSGSFESLLSVDR